MQCKDYSANGIGDRTNRKLSIAYLLGVRSRKIISDLDLPFIRQGFKDVLGELSRGQTPPPAPPLSRRGESGSPFQEQKFFLFPPLVGEG